MGPKSDSEKGKFTIWNVHQNRLTILKASPRDDEKQKQQKSLNFGLTSTPDSIDLSGDDTNPPSVFIEGGHCSCLCIIFRIFPGGHRPQFWAFCPCGSLGFGGELPFFECTSAVRESISSFLRSGPQGGIPLSATPSEITFIISKRVP